MVCNPCDVNGSCGPGHTRYNSQMAGPLKVTDTGFEVWKKDRSKGRYIFMTRADEDRLCAALHETFGDFQVINAHKTFDSPKVEWRDRVTAFPISSGPPDAPDGVSTVEIYFPWPKWELRAEPLYYNKLGTEEEKLASYAGHVVLTTPPLRIRIDRSKFLGTELMPKYPWRREALINGFIQTAWCREGPYVEAQEEFVRKLFRLVGKMTTNRLRFLRFDEEGSIVLDEAKKGYWCWAGEDALRWCREDERRVLTEHWALKRKTGHVTYGYRPRD